MRSSAKTAFFLLIVLPLTPATLPETKPEDVGRSAAAAASGGSQPAPVQFYPVPAAREITIQDLLTDVSGLGSGAASNAEIRK